MTLDGLVRLRLGQWEPIARLRRPLQEFLRFTFPRVSSVDTLQEQTIERLLSQLRPHIQSLLACEEDASGRSASHVDICATVESLIARHARNILRILFDNSWYLVFRVLCIVKSAGITYYEYGFTDIDDATFGQEILNILIELCKQICMVLGYSLRGGQAGLEAIASRFVVSLNFLKISKVRENDV